MGLDFGKLFKSESSILILGISLSLLFSFIIKTLLSGYRGPDKKKDAIISLETVLAFAIISSLYLTSDIPMIILVLISLLAYTVAKSKYDSKGHYLYQIILSILVGLAGPYSFKYLLSIIGNDSHEREYYESGGYDNRREADTAPELKLEESESEVFKDLE